MKVWIGIQFFVTLAFMYYLFGNLATIPKPQIFFYGGFILLAVYAYTELMDRNPNAIWWELINTICALSLIYINGDWFGMGESFTKWLVLYLVVANVVTYYFSRLEEDSSPVLAS